MNVYDELTFHTDPTITTVSTCDFKTFIGDTVTEKREGLYVKLIELRNVLRAKCKCDDGGDDVTVGESIFEIIESSPSVVHYSQNKVKYGNFMIEFDENMPAYRAVIECKGKKAALIVFNL